MDVFKCLSLAALEALAIRVVGGRAHNDNLTRVQTGCILFAIQYLLLKYYRVFLYHKYFSPLRHIPSPTVSRSQFAIYTYHSRGFAP